jgi:hypothetical protein
LKLKCLLKKKALKSSFNPVLSIGSVKSPSGPNKQKKIHRKAWVAKTQKVIDFLNQKDLSKNSKAMSLKGMLVILRRSLFTATPKEKPKKKIPQTKIYQTSKKCIYLKNLKKIRRNYLIDNRDKNFFNCIWKQTQSTSDRVN